MPKFLRIVFGGASLALSLMALGAGLADAEPGGVDYEKCTNRINYAGDPRSNAEINGIGYNTGTCPTPMTGVGAQPAPAAPTNSSYLYGANMMSYSARTLLTVSEPGDKAYQNPGEACRISVDSLPDGLPSGLSRGDVISGCTAALGG